MHPGIEGSANADAPTTTVPGRTRPALLVIDVQNGVVAGAPRRDEVLATIGLLLGGRAVGRLVVAGAQTDAWGSPR